MNGKVKKLRLNKETLHSLGGRSRAVQGFDSCVDSCYLVSCGGGCDISTGMQQTVIDTQ
jgi:hypothetical protein